MRSNLNSLQIAGRAGYQTEKKCLEGTRVEILDMLRDWCFNDGADEGARLALIVGQAGLGKSAIAHSLAHLCKEARRLGAFFVFANDCGSENLFRTVACRLADVDLSYASKLSEILSGDSDLATTPSISRQFNELLRKPLQSFDFVGPLVIILDALDECSTGRQQVIQCLVEGINSLPSNICILVTSRPAEAKFLREQFDDDLRLRVIDLETMPVAISDIQRFVSSQLCRLRSERSGQVIFSENDFSSLAKSSEGLFEYAAVVC
jgi:hypothetical protein